MSASFALASFTASALGRAVARRNLTPEARAYFIGTLYNMEKVDRGGDRKSSGNSCHLIGRTREKIGERLKVSLARKPTR